MKTERTKSGIIVPEGSLDPEPPERTTIAGMADHLARILSNRGFGPDDIKAIGRSMMKAARKFERRKQ
jgi:hypothetical protein